MKKMFAIFLLALIPLMLSSCYSSYDCTCHFKTPGGTDSTFIEANIHKSQSGALQECNKQKQNLINIGDSSVFCIVPI